MSAEIITRVPLERYLRATGWEPYAGGWWTRDGARVAALEGMNQSETDVQVARIASAEGYAGLSVIAARLGLCEAAEHLIVRADGIARQTAWTQAQRDAWALQESELRVQAHELLEMAGVDPKRWNETRRVA